MSSTMRGAADHRRSTAGTHHQLVLAKPTPMRELADQLHCDRSYITSLADKLEERGLVKRIPGEDRRVKLLALTDEGMAVRNKIAKAVANDKSCSCG